MITYEGKEVFENLEEVLLPKHTALVIHDMQNDPCKPESAMSKFRGRSFDCARITPNVLRLREAARKAGVRVLYTQYTNQPRYVSTSASMMFKSKDWTKPSDKRPPEGSVDGTWGWQIIDELKPGAGEISVHKYRRDTFVGTNFDNLLRSMGVKTIVSCGIATERGIQPTALTASFLDYYVVIPEDAIMGWSPELVDASIKLLETTVTISKTEDLLNVWAKHAKA